MEGIASISARQTTGHRRNPMRAQQQRCNESPIFSTSRVPGQVRVCRMGSWAGRTEGNAFDAGAPAQAAPQSAQWPLFELWINSEPGSCVEYIRLLV